MSKVIPLLKEKTNQVATKKQLRIKGSNLLTHREIKSIKADAYFDEKEKEANGTYKSEKIASGELKRSYSDGLGLSLYLKDRKTMLWEFNYVSPVTKKRRKTSFGKYPDVSLSSAREKRQEYRDLVARGIDPIDLKKENRIEKRNLERGDFQSVAIEWLDHKLDIAEIQQITYDKRLETYHAELFPWLGAKNITDIEHEEFTRIIKKKVKSAPTRMSRVFDDTKSIFIYAMSNGYLKENFFNSIKKSSLVPKENPKHYPKITKKKVLKELVNCIYDYHGGYTVRNALKFVLHAPLRMMNLRTLEWQEVDFKKQRIVIPRHKMKLKDKNLPDFELPLSDEAYSILNDQYKISKGCEFVFMNPGDTKPIAAETINRTLERMGFNDESRGRRIRVHGFRGTYRSLIDTLDKKGKFKFRPKELILDHHEPKKSVRAYLHEANYNKKLKKIVNFWSHYLLSLRNSEIKKKS